MKHTIKLALPFLMIAGILTDCGSQTSEDTSSAFRHKRSSLPIPLSMGRLHFSVVEQRRGLFQTRMSKHSGQI